MTKVHENTGDQVEGTRVSQQVGSATGAADRSGSEPTLIERWSVQQGEKNIHKRIEMYSSGMHKVPTQS